MEAIPKLIFNLLAQKKQVVLPQFGTLSVEAKPVDIQSGKLSVPRFHVVFSPEQNGKTLPEIIAEQSGITLKEVKPQYNRWISKFKNSATEKGELTLESVGNFSLQQDLTYQINLSKELDHILNPFGIQDIQLTVLKQEKESVQKKKKAVSKTPEKKKEKKKDVKKSSPVNAPKADIKPSEKQTKAKSEDKIKSKAKTKKINYRARWIAAACVLSLLVFFSGYYAYTRGFFTPEEKRSSGMNQVTRTETKAEIPVETPSDPGQINEIDTPEIEAVEENLSEITTAPEPVSSGEVYHIIAGVFSTRENAERFAEINSFDPSSITLIPTTENRYMVSIGKFATKEEADKEMKRRSDKFPELWVSKRKK